MIEPLNLPIFSVKAITVRTVRQTHYAGPEIRCGYMFTSNARYTSNFEINILLSLYARNARMLLFADLSLDSAMK